MAKYRHLNGTSETQSETKAWSVVTLNCGVKAANRRGQSQVAKMIDLRVKVSSCKLHSLNPSHRPHRTTHHLQVLSPSSFYLLILHLVTTKTLLAEFALDILCDMAFFFVVGTKGDQSHPAEPSARLTDNSTDFTSPLKGYEGVTAQCHNCGNWSAHPIQSWDWFTFCFVPIIPLGGKHRDVGLPAATATRVESH
jgi:hypothetical protein